jgi:hypothetical protein
MLAFLFGEGAGDRGDGRGVRWGQPGLPGCAGLSGPAT